MVYVCNADSFTYFGYTIGNIYKYDEETGLIENDLGIRWTFTKSSIVEYFMTLAEYREQQINSLLDEEN